jgi:hypothetical protein
MKLLLWCLDEPLHVASEAKADHLSTKNTLYKNRHLPLKERKRTEKKGVVSMSVEMMYQRCYIPTTKVGGFTGRFAKGNQSERESTRSTFLEDSCSSA